MNDSAEVLAFSSPLAGPATLTAGGEFVPASPLASSSLQDRLLDMAAVDGVESGSGNELTPYTS